MKISVRAFGQLTDIIKIDQVELDAGGDTDHLIQALNKLYPALAGKKFVIAVDKKTISANTVLSNESTVALLPPFSGG